MNRSKEGVHVSFIDPSAVEREVFEFRHRLLKTRAEWETPVELYGFIPAKFILAISRDEAHDLNALPCDRRISFSVTLNFLTSCFRTLSHRGEFKRIIYAFEAGRCFIN